MAWRFQRTVNGCMWRRGEARTSFACRADRPRSSEMSSRSDFALTTSGGHPTVRSRSEEHTSELQSLTNLVCRLLLEKKKDRIEETAIRLRAFCSVCIREYLPNSAVHFLRLAPHSRSLIRQSDGWQLRRELKSRRALA